MPALLEPPKSALLGSAKTWWWCCCEPGPPGECGPPCIGYPALLTLTFAGIILQDPQGKVHELSCGGVVPFNTGAPQFCNYLTSNFGPCGDLAPSFIAAGCSTDPFGNNPLGDGFWFAQFAIQVFGQGNAFIYYCRQVLEGDSPVPPGDYPFCIFTTQGPPWVLIEPGTCELGHA